GQSIETLLDLLREPENHVRELAKIELGKHEAGKVMAAADAWMKRLNPNDPDYAHQLTEVLWLHQWHNVVDAPLLRRLLRYPEPNVRAAATRVLCYWRDRIPDAVQLLKVQAADENPRVRLHAIRAASFISSPEAVDAALASIGRPFDYYLDYTLGETLKQLRPHWISQLEDVAALEKENPMKIEFLLRTVPIQDLLGMKRNDRVREQLVKRTGVSQATRAEVLEELVQSEKRSGAELLLGYLKQTGDNDRRAMARLLANRPSVELKAVRGRLAAFAIEETADVQPFGWAALVAADGSFDTAWTEASHGQAAILALVSGIPSLADVELRARALPLLIPLLAPLAELTKETSALQAAAIRAAVSCRREPEAVFEALTALISAKQNVPTAVSGMRQLPRNAWHSSSAPLLGEALVAWAESYTAAERTTPEFLDLAQTTREFLDQLPGDRVAPLRERLIRLSVPVFTVRTVHEEMRYDTLRLVVEAGKPFRITLENEDSMLHNLVIVKPGARERVANAAVVSPEKLDAQGRAYVPASPDILAATRLLDAGQSETITLTAPSEEGIYEYVCTFPGHWTLMWGQLIVTRQLNASLPPAAAVAPAGPPVPNGNHSHPN
ncbi:MAG TPA: HEAT repeat domain-containing protein, partial [Opitutaceae bacterium]|nr:HEAT repeat domain-containing protein [Opitutaceae bacterium]